MVPLGHSTLVAGFQSLALKQAGTEFGRYRFDASSTSDEGQTARAKLSEFPGAQVYSFEPRVQRCPGSSCSVAELLKFEIVASYPLYMMQMPLFASFNSQMTVSTAHQNGAAKVLRALVLAIIAKTAGL